LLAPALAESDASIVEMSDMTWPDVQGAIARGFTTAIVPSGGIEENGPHMILGKHDRIVGFTARAIAKGLGDALVAPVVSYVPEGQYDPPTGAMKFPGTIGVPDTAFAAVLEGVARSLKAGGFKTICFIADHGGSVRPQAAVAARLTQEWTSQGVRVLDISDYYNAGDAQMDALKSQGETAQTIGDHAGIADTSELMAVNPKGVDLSRVANGPKISGWNGATGDPSRASAERGRVLLDIKIQAAIKQIKALRP
jgi:creatinine amidohydrolase